jgi:hypothetical protein
MRPVRSHQDILSTKNHQNIVSTYKFKFKMFLFCQVLNIYIFALLKYVMNISTVHYALGIKIT